MMRLGTYQKRILWRLNQNPLDKSALTKGYSKQYMTLKERGLIKISNSKIYITEKGKREYKLSTTKVY